LTAIARRSFRLQPIGYAVLFAVFAFSLFAPGARSQVRSNIGPVNLSAILGDSISVAASPGLVNFTLVQNGVATGSPTIAVNTGWVLGHPTTITTYGYFSNSTSALTDGAGHNIPSSSVSGNPDGGGFQAFTGACPFSANTCLTVFTAHLPSAGFKLRGSHNDTLQLQISTVGLSLAPGTYTGVLHIRAQAI
jgi:hypothetical protein